MKMEQLTALIHNFNTNCHKQYTKVSNFLGNRLDESLKEIERFYYSDFWLNRFKRRMREEDADYIPIELDIILGITSDLRDSTRFKLFDEDPVQNGISNNGTMIALNVNLDENEMNDSHINNVIMHEFGHRQYNQRGFSLIVNLNKRIIGFPGEHIKNDETLGNEDYKYFTNDNELRQRIIPIIKEMYNNGWTLEETYDLSHNLFIDDIKNIFTKEYIIHLIQNLL